LDKKGPFLSYTFASLPDRQLLVALASSTRLPSTREKRRGELHALVGVEYFRATAAQRLLQCLAGGAPSFSDLYIYYTFDNTHGYLLTVELATSGK
jgi:hypothetical protein